MSEFMKRLLSGIVLVIIALITIITGGNVLLATTFIISIIGMNEFYKAVKIDKEVPAFIGYAGAGCYYLLLLLNQTSFEMIFAIGVLMAMMICFVVTYPKYKPTSVMAAYFALFYVAVMLSYIYQARVMEDGKYIVWLIFLSSWGCDTLAYCAGKLTGQTIGNHKMTPVLSPKKSIEGAVGGLVGAGLLGVIYAYIFKDNLTSFANPVLSCGILCVLSGAISMFGDLAASGIKRNYDIKDYGKLIPGHGGILDRFDSVIFTAPIVYFLAMMLK